MTASPRSIGRWVLGICALASGLLPMTSASALSYPPSPDDDTVVAGSFFTVTFECEIGETVVFDFNGDTVSDVCSAPQVQSSAQAVANPSIVLLSSFALTSPATAQLSPLVLINPGIARARFRAPSTPGVYILTIIAGGETYTREVVVQGKPGGGGGGGGGGGRGSFGGGIATRGGMPRTGYGSLTLSLTSGFAAVVTGAGLVVVAKRRSRQRLVV